MTYIKEINSLRTAYHDGRLTLYLGAGVSTGNGLPTWEQLVLAMYYGRLSPLTTIGRYRPYANYLFAIAEWHLTKRREPLDISARKIRSHFQSGSIFLNELRNTLYAGFGEEKPDPYMMLNANPTLGAVVDLCTGKGSNHSLHAVITYNYDYLLELALEDTNIRAIPIWKPGTKLPSKSFLPIYHVHGYLPNDGRGSTATELIFTEEEYHLASQDAYSWSNLVQIKCMSSSVGLMIGLSLSDRNMRRLLDAVQRAPIRTENYVLLQKPQKTVVSDQDVNDIDENARKYHDLFLSSGIKSDQKVFTEIRQIVSQVDDFEKQANESIMNKLGVKPLWYDDHDKIPEIINTILE